MTDERISDRKVVVFTYAIVDDTGVVREQSDLPLSYIHGVSGRMYEKVERALEGASIGDEISVTLSPEEGFGPHDPELTYTDAVDNVPPEYRRLGAEAMFQNDAGETITMVVTKIENGMITLDGNHPFAGQSMTFKIAIKEVRDATAEELASGEATLGGIPLNLH